MTRDYVVLDVFTDTPLTGNALAVFLDGSGLDGAVMQRAAREFNLSETVFVLPGDAESDAHIRIFTPAAEVPFAGHPTLGASFVVGERDGLSVVRLRTASGVVVIELQRDDGGAIVRGEMAQPIPSVSPFPAEHELLPVLGVQRSELPVELYDNGLSHVYVTLESFEDVERLRPDLGALAALESACVSCFAVSGHRVKTRMFAPRFGVPEDPATGSAAGPLALHLARHGRIGFGDQIEIIQGAEIGRPSTLYARVTGTAEAVEQVLVAGEAVLVAEGQYRLR